MLIALEVQIETHVSMIPSTQKPKYTKTTGGMDREDWTGNAVCSALPNQ